MPSKGSKAKKTRSAPRREGPLPVTLLSGFLGSGKTTLLKHVLENANGLRIGVLVNDVAALNIDAQLVANHDKAKSLVQLENGCICCDLREPLVEHLVKLSKDRHLDYCIVESTGVAEPSPVAEAFSFSTGQAVNENGKLLASNVPLSAFVTLDTCVTVVDAKNFPGDLATRKKASDRWKDSKDSPEGQRDIAGILAEQLEFADVIVINKCDLVTEDEVKRVSSAVRAFNVGASIVEVEHAAVKMEDVVHTGKFNMEEVASNMKWMVEIQKEEGAIDEPKEVANGELEEYGINSVVYRRRKPFHPYRLAEAAIKLSNMGNALLRSKGFVWVATRNEGYGEWSQTGAVYSLRPGGKWFCELTPDEWPSTDPQFVAHAHSLMDPNPAIKDRRIQMVFIGQNLKKNVIIEMMDKCLLTDEEMEGGVEKWMGFKDPFQKWNFNPQ